jgi:hypothetical protein
VSSLRELAEGLARCGESVPGLRCYPVMHPKPEPPCLCVAGPIRWTYDATMDGVWTPVFECWVLVLGADLYRGQQNLEPYIAPSGTKSVPAAIYRDPTLGGAAHTTRVLGAVRPPAEVETAGGRLVGCALEVEVEAM